MFQRSVPLPPSLTLPDGTEVGLRRSGRARRLILTVSRATGGAMLTLPPRASLPEARAFLTARADWLAQTRARLPQPALVRVGVRLPVAGTEVAITPAPVRACRLEDAALLVPEGRPPGPPVAAWLRERARAALVPACSRHAAALPAGARRLQGIVLRDTRSRWGSCTAQGRLMFSWRLAMAPPQVLDYVAAHEVAHLAHMDHSPAFWAEVGRLMPGWTRQRDWLRHHGTALQSWQFR